MDLNKTLLDNSNYVEIYVLNNKYTDQIGIPTGLSKNKFYDLLAKFKNDNFKFFQKEFKQYTIGNIYYENYDNEDVKVNKKECKHFQINNEFITTFYNKNKLTMLNLPSTVKINDIQYIRKLTFRINNRIYLNFECKKNNNNNNIYYSIYINYNHDETVDYTITNNIIKPLLQKLGTTC
jgi:hypothetical protein